MQITKEQHRYMMKQLKKIESDKASGKKEEVKHLSESTKKALGLIGYV
jgi:hypothetical protein